MTRPVASPRLIRLRRPPRLVRADDRFVPAVSLDLVEDRWRRLVAANPRYFDGEILHVLHAQRDGHGGVTIHVAVASYRFYAVQRPDPDLPPLDCGVRPLGAKAITRIDGRILMGRRSTSVAFHPGCWEFLPGGGLEVEDDPASCVRRELAEEAGLECAAPPRATALLYDPVALSWEVVHEIAARRPSEAAGDDHAWEHSERRLVEPGAWPAPLADVARAMMPLIDRRWAERGPGMPR
jgi:8-oxo-dGTP pyrophosphatase MutT (NUDIX family)